MPSQSRVSGQQTRSPGAPPRARLCQYTFGRDDQCRDARARMRRVCATKVGRRFGWRLLSNVDDDGTTQLRPRREGDPLVPEGARTRKSSSAISTAMFLSKTGAIGLILGARERGGMFDAELTNTPEYVAWAKRRRDAGEEATVHEFLRLYANADALLVRAPAVAVAAAARGAVAPTRWQLLRSISPRCRWQSSQTTSLC